MIIVAGLIIAGVSLNSQKAESKGEQNSAGENQILGEESNNPAEIIGENSSASQEESVDENALENNNQISTDSTKGKINISKNKPTKKSKKHKSSSKDNDDSSENNDIAGVLAPAQTALSLDFSVSSGTETKKFAIEFKEGETVYDLMKEAKAQGKLSYGKSADETYGVYINEINGLKEGADADWTQNKYWILYVDGKSSSLGCSNHKLAKSDNSIEWRYEKYSF